MLDRWPWGCSKSPWDREQATGRGATIEVEIARARRIALAVTNVGRAGRAGAFTQGGGAWRGRWDAAMA
jgi:hypothetical protein